MKRLFLSILLLLTFAIPSWATTLYKVAHSGNWATANEWATTQNHAYPGDAGAAPVAGDTAIIDVNFAGYTVTLATNAACAVLDMTGNTTGVLALAGYVLSTTGNITLAGTGSNVTATSGLFNVGGTTPTITCNGIYIPTLSFTAATTYTLGTNLLVTGTLKYSVSGAPIMSGAFNISCGTLNLGNSITTLTLVHGQTLTVGTALLLSLNAFGTSTITSDTASGYEFGLQRNSGKC